MKTARLILGVEISKMKNNRSINYQKKGFGLSEFALNSAYYFLILCAFASHAQKPNLLHEIEKEAAEKSEVMKLTSELTDVYAPRLSGTDQYLQAVKWVDSTFRGWGYETINLEPFEEKIKGWQLQHFSLEQLAPNYRRITGQPIAWTASIEQTEDLQPILIENFESLRGFEQDYQGRLNDKLVLLEVPDDYSFLNKTIAKRFTEEQLLEEANNSKARPMPSFEAMQAYLLSLNDSIRAFYKILEKEKAAALFVQSNRAFGIIRTEGTPFYKPNDNEPVSSFVIANEDFGRIKRAMQLGKELKFRIAQQSMTSYSEDRNVNVITRIEGTDDLLKKEVVMIGAHFDTWHSSSGATDNSANCAVIMEAARILKKLGPFKRTVVFALWGGEELGVFGSTSYVTNHLGDLTRGVANANAHNVSAYLNLDNGAGKIRGLYLQGNPNAKPFFENIFEEVAGKDSRFLSLNNSIGSDHMVFDIIGIPSFQFIQDQNGYYYLTHHTNLDTYEYILEEDLKRNVSLISKMVFLLSEAVEKVPRK